MGRGSVGWQRVVIIAALSTTFAVIIEHLGIVDWIANGLGAR